MLKRLASAAGAAVILLSCATKPVPPAPAERAPFAAVENAAIKALDPRTVKATASLTVTNPGSGVLRVERLNVLFSAEGFACDVPVELAERADIAPRSSRSFPVEFTARDEAESAEAPRRVPWKMTASVSARDVAGRAVELPVASEGSFPRISEPVFEIRTIKIKRAELINTRLKVTLRISNPNDFDLSFRSISYELFGEGRFWADGVVNQPTAVPAEGFVDIDLALIMNFINMKRDLLDQVIKLATVRYRFKGEAAVDTTVDFLPAFTMRFDQADTTIVIE